MTERILEKGQSESMHRSEKVTSQEEDNSISSSSCSSPVSSANSASTSLGAELSKVTLSGSSATSQLEQLATINLLTVRIKFRNEVNHIDEQRSLISEIESISHNCKGIPVSAAHIENYEYLPDAKRLQIIEDNKDIYAFEGGNIEYAKSYSDEEQSLDWRYDNVLSTQFKRQNALQSVTAKVQQFLKANEKQIEKWSISVNEHALAQPGNLYIKGVPKNMSMDQIIPIFSKFGPISSLKIICDNVTGESLGYGFMSYPLGSQAFQCINELNGKSIQNSTLFINFHIERKERERIYRVNVKENNDDEKFKGVFVGNLPLHNPKGDVVTPHDVIELFKGKLAPIFPDLGIVSYYFPRKNSRSDIQFEEQDDEREDGDGTEEEETETEKPVRHGFVRSSEGNVSQIEENPLQKYGFIKFTNHAQALRAVELFNNFEWFGTNLIVNKAVQNKAQNLHARKSPVSSGLSNRSENQYFTTQSNPYGYFGGSGNLYFPYVNSRGSISASSTCDRAPQDIDPLYGTSRPLSAGPYINPYNVMGGIPSPGTPTRPFDSTPPGSSMMPLHPYNMMPQNVPFGLPLPTRDQQESNLYVKHLPLSWKDEDLYEFYQKFGDIISAKIITVGGSKCKEQGNRQSTTPEDEDQKSIGTSRGYGFVCFKNPLDASHAILATDGFQLTETHILHVSFAQKRAKSNQGAALPTKAQSATADSAPEVGNLRAGSRRASYNEHSGSQYNLKFLNAMRQQRGPTSGNFPNTFMPGSGGWPGMPMIPSVPPALSSFAFVSPSPSHMLGSYLVQPTSMMTEDESDYEGSDVT